MYLSAPRGCLCAIFNNLRRYLNIRYQPASYILPYTQSTLRQQSSTISFLNLFSTSYSTISRTACNWKEANNAASISKNTTRETHRPESSSVTSACHATTVQAHHASSPGFEQATTTPPAGQYSSVPNTNYAMDKASQTETDRRRDQEPRQEPTS